MPLDHPSRTCVQPILQNTPPPLSVTNVRARALELQKFSRKRHFSSRSHPPTKPLTSAKYSHQTPSRFQERTHSLYSTHTQPHHNESKHPFATLNKIDMYTKNFSSNNHSFLKEKSKKSKITPASRIVENINTLSQPSKCTQASPLPYLHTHLHLHAYHPLFPRHLRSKEKWPRYAP